MNHIGQLFRSARKKAGLTPKDAASAAGYRNINKGLRRSRTLEDDQTTLHDPRIVERFAAILGIDGAAIAKATALDWQVLERPITPYLVERLMSAVYRRHELPEDCTVGDARKIAAKLSVETGRSYCLVLSRIRAVFFYPNGKHRESYLVPNMSSGHHDAFMAQARTKSQERS